ncbi:hypothetical protein O181_013643 [Austropuccinia psidii MF-1]|uniref:HTH CENPB-type domain-containing protein n=1 Tax=Austropuccinia psidii MF-1 TaxID=1389203 RepID=A0A9Q3BZ29_9BASI|nr:hypothetical protein [Austropuccinia psidii MF-1]
MDEHNLDAFEASICLLDCTVEQKKKLLDKQQYAPLTQAEKDWFDCEGNLVDEQMVVDQLLAPSNNSQETTTLTGKNLHAFATFQVPNGWLDTFEQHNNLRCYKRHEEAGSMEFT